MRRPLLVALLLLSPAGASAARKAVKRPIRKAKPAASAPAKPAAVAPVAAAAPTGSDDSILFAFGAELRAEPGEAGLRADSVRKGTPAADAGLRPGDRVLRLAAAEPARRVEAAAALRAWAPQSRASAVVRRGLEVAALSAPALPVPSYAARRADSLSARELSLASASVRRAAAAGKASVAAAPPLDATVRADQGVWVRFPDGLKAGLKTGDLVAAETTTGVTADGSLDFLALPPKSKIWARALEAADDGELRSVRLHFFKLELAGGGTYPVLGAATAVSGDQSLLRATAGGTVIAAVPVPDPEAKRRKGPELLVDAEARVRVRLLEPVRLVEPASFWRAGPGLWIRTIEKNGRRLFEVTHSVAERSAAAAGLKVGDLLDEIGGRSSQRLEFPDAVDALYGAPGSDLKVSVVAGKSSKTLSLRRGARWDDGKPSALLLPFQVR